ncbi:hypothetical protein BKA62DRAFT_656911 [Auriculariales sp. MPI-PUGE-AT-0066]|nr:hypothetical protein BKA62DRAFT_656911 [Auriculariales sp. MPI-PUGE-AT-0066]
MAAVVLDNDAFDTVASFCSAQTVSLLCRASFAMNDLLRPRLYRSVCVSSFAQSQAFLVTISKRNKDLGRLVISYQETPGVLMTHLLNESFATALAVALYRMANLEDLKLAHSLALVSLHKPIEQILVRLVHLKSLHLYDPPPGWTGLVASPNRSFYAFTIVGNEHRFNSCRTPAPPALTRLLFHSTSSLRVLRLTSCSVASIVNDCAGVVWDTVEHLALDQFRIPDSFIYAFPSLHTLEVWSDRPMPNLIPDYGWPRLTRLDLIVCHTLISRSQISDTRPKYQRLRSVSELRVRLGVPHEALWPDTAQAALSCVVKPHLQAVRIGSFVPWGQRSESVIEDRFNLFSWCSTVDTLELRIRIMQARDPNFLCDLKQCNVLRLLVLVFDDLETMAEFENRFLQPPLLEVEISVGQTARLPSTNPKSGVGKRGIIPYDASVGTIELILRRVYDQTGASFQRVWERADRGGWSMSRSITN